LCFQQQMYIYCWETEAFLFLFCIINIFLQTLYHGATQAMLQCFNLLEHDLYFLFFFITIMELHWFERGFGLSHEYLHNIYFFLSSALRRVVDCVRDVLSYLINIFTIFLFFSLSSASWSAVDCERRFKLLEHDVYNVLHRWVLSQAAVFWLQGKHQQYICEWTFSDCEFEMWNRLDDFF